MNNKIILVIWISLAVGLIGHTKENVFANSNQISSKSSSGKTISAFPDVCNTPPSSAGSVSIPYPNAGSDDQSKGSKGGRTGRLDPHVANQFGVEVGGEVPSRFSEISGEEVDLNEAEEEGQSKYIIPGHIGNKIKDPKKKR
ncbi:MAG: hypothetical protein GY858_09315 [Candidatus Omnitrophica bacterium]|nr:hypothetical protein [Candidatus Omnitrophota bacterium]